MAGSWREDSSARIFEVRRRSLPSAGATAPRSSDPRAYFVLLALLRRASEHLELFGYARHALRGRVKHSAWTWPSTRCDESLPLDDATERSDFLDRPLYDRIGRSDALQLLDRLGADAFMFAMISVRFLALHRHGSHRLADGGQFVLRSIRSAMIWRSME